MGNPFEKHLESLNKLVEIKDLVKELVGYQYAGQKFGASFVAGNGICDLIGKPPHQAVLAEDKAGGKVNGKCPCCVEHVRTITAVDIHYRDILRRIESALEDYEPDE